MLNNKFNLKKLLYLQSEEVLRLLREFSKNWEEATGHIELELRRTSIAKPGLENHFLVDILK